MPVTTPPFKPPFNVDDPKWRHDYDAFYDAIDEHASRIYRDLFTKGIIEYIQFRALACSRMTQRYYECQLDILKQKGLYCKIHYMDSTKYFKDLKMAQEAKRIEDAKEQAERAEKKLKEAARLKQEQAERAEKKI